MGILLPLLKAVLTLVLLTGVLAVLLLIANHYLMNFGPCRILINREKELTIQGGPKLLSVLADNRIFIPSACGGRGTCGYCKVKVLSGGGQILPTEEPYLSPAERADNLRLSCCIRVRSDMELVIPEEILALREYDTRVERIRDLTYDIREYRLALVDPPSIPFRAGQYVNFVIPPYGDSPEPVYRAYSMSSPPSSASALEFVIRRVPQGIATTYCFDHLKEGDTLKINGPYGEFTLRPTDADMVMIAGSTGIAPIKAILENMAEASSSRKITLFFGVLELRDLFYLDLLLELQKKLPNLTFIPALSRKAPEDKWDSESGLITDVVARHVPNPSSAEAYLCGSPGMIDASIRVLHEKGITDDRIFYDKFA